MQYTSRQAGAAAAFVLLFIGATGAIAVNVAAHYIPKLMPTVP